MNIKAKNAGKMTTLTIDKTVFFLSEEEVRRLRSEMNRMLQRIHDKRIGRTVARSPGR